MSSSDPLLYQPLVSIIVAVYNAKDTLQQCIDSIAAQTYPNKELIIIDGASQDGSIEIIQNSQHKIAYSVSEPDTGIYNAWNKGLEVAKGDWICFLGADDFYLANDVLENSIAQLKDVSEDTMVAYGKVMTVSPAGEWLEARGQPWNEISGRFQHLMCIPHPGTLHRSALFKQYGGFDESFRIAGDYELLLRVLKKTPAYFIHNLVTVGVRLGGVSTTSQNALASLMEIRKAQKLQGQWMPSMIWLITVLKVYIRLALFWMLGAKLAGQLLGWVRRCPGLSLNWTEK